MSLPRNTAPRPVTRIMSSAWMRAMVAASLVFTAYWYSRSSWATTFSSSAGAAAALAAAMAARNAILRNMISILSFPAGRHPRTVQAREGYILFSTRTRIDLLGLVVEGRRPGRGARETVVHRFPARNVRRALHQDALGATRVQL